MLHRSLQSSPDPFGIAVTPSVKLKKTNPEVIGLVIEDWQDKFEEQMVIQPTSYKDMKLRFTIKGWPLFSNST